MRTYHKGYRDVSLLSRCNTICNSEKNSLQRYIFDDKYEKQCKMKLKTVQRSGVVDSISNLLRNYICDSKCLVNLLLKLLLVLYNNNLTFYILFTCFYFTVYCVIFYMCLLFTL